MKYSKDFNVMQKLTASECSLQHARLIKVNASPCTRGQGLAGGSGMQNDECYLANVQASGA